MNNKLSKREKERQKYLNNPVMLMAFDDGYKAGYEEGRLSGWKWREQAINNERNQKESK
jgi:hypothetical protein